MPHVHVGLALLGQSMHAGTTELYSNINFHLSMFHFRYIAYSLTLFDLVTESLEV